MSSHFFDDSVDCPRPGAVRSGATVLEGIAHNGKPCRIVDNTGTIAREELQDALDRLIRERRFGIAGRSASGGNTIALDRPACGHVQFGEYLYRILLFPYEARIERF